MKKIFFLIIILSFLAGGLGVIAENNLPRAGITPDSSFYFLKSWKESIQTFFTFGAENKTKQYSHLADIRLAEYQKMIEKGKTEIAQKTLNKYEDQLNRALAQYQIAKEEDKKELSDLISEKTQNHTQFLSEVLTNIPEPAKMGIEKAIEASKKSYETINDGWSQPVPTSGAEWTGVIISIDLEKKNIKTLRAAGTGNTPIITITVSDNTKIKDDSNNILSINDLKPGDIISFTGEYQMRGKFTDAWEVRTKKVDKIIISGKCIQEGKSGDIAKGNIQCCPGLTLIEQKYCTNCGDSMCKPPETKNNCQLDCVKNTEPITTKIYINANSFNLINKTFEGQTLTEKKKIKILTDNSTKIYQNISAQNPILENTYYTFAEFYSLIKNWNGPIWPFTVKGTLEQEGIIKASEIFYFVQ